MRLISACSRRVRPVVTQCEIINTSLNDGPLAWVRDIWLVLLSVQIHTDRCVISGPLSVWIRTAVCASIYHTIHTLTLNLTQTLNLTLISSYLTNKHQYLQPNWMPSRLRELGRFLLAILTIRGFVSTCPTDNNIYSDIWAPPVGRSPFGLQDIWAPGQIGAGRFSATVTLRTLLLHLF